MQVKASDSDDDDDDNNNNTTTTTIDYAMQGNEICFTGQRENAAVARSCRMTIRYDTIR